MTTKLKQVLLLFLMLLAQTWHLSAQDNRAIISGIVTDETGLGVIEQQYK